MGKYCCFSCPTSDYSEKNLEDRCAFCGKQYGFMLSHPPETIGNYRILSALSRGFYGAAYVAEWGRFNRKYVLKITPKAFYEGLKKNTFEEETELHNTIALSAEHVIDITDTFDAIIEFSDDKRTTVDCHIMVLEYAEGSALEKYIDGSEPINAKAICQIAIDLLRLRSEFEARQLNHNDLHANNLIVEKIDPKARRINAIDDTIRVVAIDLGSIASDSKSTDDRHGDVYFIAQHVERLLNRLLQSPNGLEDRDYRVALALQGVIRGCLVPPQNSRFPGCEDLVKQIINAYERATQPWRPWNTPVQLSGFADHYNAQTLQSWGVPRLLVDPENRWIGEVSRSGPQIITGMRGCGKTMLLRSLDIHARAAQLREKEPAEETLDRIKRDGYVGLFVSAQRLLDLRDSVSKLEHRLTRLFANYALQASRALLHLQDIDPSAIAAAAHLTLGNAVADSLQGADGLRVVTSIDELELRLNKIAALASKGGSGYSVEYAPAQAFPYLAEKLRLCSPVWANSQVLFLLDDVSTRHMEVERVEELLSSLLFQSPHCAFKFTSEWQTIELGLHSPGRIHPIRIGRDVSVFDLGSLVHQTVNGSGKGRGADFISQVLQQRAAFHADHPRATPRELLGDVTLEQVAREIAAANTTSKDRKQVYRGLSCVTNVCVGDIGDVIKLYEEIVKHATAGRSSISTPIPADVQSECFQELSSQRLYELNRRAGIYKEHALTFAEAANELLVKSFRQAKKKGAETPVRLRQYSSIYVRVTSGDKQKLNQQIDQLRDLIDAGVFVYTGGSARTKTKDSNPIQQFKLSYRKICGLAAYIGLADRDRFELSGADLEEWLNSPSKEILLKNLSADVDEEAENAVAGDGGRPEATTDTADTSPSQSMLFDPNLIVTVAPKSETATAELSGPIGISLSEFSIEQLADTSVDQVLAGLGFEDRTLESNRLIARYASPTVVHLVRYDEPGHSDAILEAWRTKGVKAQVHDHPMLPAHVSVGDGLLLVDVSGLSKPFIFDAVRRELMTKGRVLVAHMGAKLHYPLDEDLKEMLAAERANDPLLLLASLAGVLKGETGPYTSVRLLDEAVDQSRKRALIAFASAKHERLFSLMDRREFDMIDVMTPDNDGPRAKVANYAAQFLCNDYESASIDRVDTNDLGSLINRLDQRYLEFYVGSGANVEIGLTGSKAQAVASAVVSARRKVAQAWYLKPAKFDVARFSSGVGNIRIFDIRVGSASRPSAER